MWCSSGMCCPWYGLVMEHGVTMALLQKVAHAICTAKAIEAAVKMQP